MLQRPEDPLWHSELTSKTTWGEASDPKNREAKSQLSECLFVSIENLPVLAAVGRATSTGQSDNFQVNAA